MPETCASHLSHFAFAVDTVDDATYNNLQDLLKNYFVAIDASFFAILIDGVRVNEQPGLKTLWSSRQVEDSASIFDRKGEYRGIRSFCYHKNVPLWITAEDEGSLARPETKLRDSWSLSPDLPSYLDQGDSEAKTGVLVPLRYGGRVFGVMILEFAHCLELTQTTKQELSTIVDAVARLVWLHETTKNQLEGTNKAFQQLKLLFHASTRPLTKPTIFLASSSRADQNIVACIRAVLEEFAEHFDVIYWKDISESGSVNAQILKAIASSQHGVCYLSECVESPDAEEFPYRDSPNALFEAGMLQALTNNPSAEPVGWIPIREDVQFSGPPPFDVAGERLVVVPRSDLANFNKDSFEVSLRKAVNALVP